MGQINFITSLVLVGLFSIAIVTFAINFAIDNGSLVNIANDPDFAKFKTGVSENLTIFYSDINTSSESMYKSTISTQTESTEGGTSFKVGPGTSLALASSIVTLSFQKIFGSDTGFGIFLTALIAVLGFISIMYIWKTWKGGSPD